MEAPSFLFLTNAFFLQNSLSYSLKQIIGDHNIWSHHLDLLKRSSYWDYQLPILKLHLVVLNSTLEICQIQMNKVITKITSNDQV